MNPNPNPKQILVVQNVGAISLFSFIQIIAEPLGLVRDSDFTVLVDSDAILREVPADSKLQTLLIIDNVDLQNPDDTDDLYHLIGALRHINSRSGSQLIIVGYSSLRHDPTYFDYVISKRQLNSAGDLQDLITLFLAGNLQPQHRL